MFSQKMFGVHLYSVQGKVYIFQCTVYNAGVQCTLYIIQICAILHRVLTILSDIGGFEQYCNLTYPTRPNKVTEKITVTDLV